MFLQQLVTGISVGGIYALLATGYSLIYSLLDFSNWAHGEVAMIGAYVALVVSSSLGGMPFVLASMIGIAGAAIVSYLNERIAYRRIRHNNSPNMFLMIAAMGLSTVYQQAANLIFTGKYRQFDFRLPVSTVQIGNTYLGVLDLASLVITAVILVGLIFLINKTQFGLNVRAIASNPYAAKVLGVKVDRSVASVFLLAGGLAGVAGILYGMKYNIFPTMGNVGLKAFIASVIGGLGSVPGAIVGAIVLGVIETLVSAYVSSSLRDFFSFALLIVLLLVKPSGLFGVDVQDKA
ncbi:MAG: branched-chain amino acid ABC transporter permease [Lachnospiraceae bacterium]|nr:branched-chain amino acid ABC transporter permease [Lachnospiraceae bacterium]